MTTFTVEAVREGERIGNRLNRWHVVARDTGIGPITTSCGRVIERSVAFTAPQERIFVEAGNPKVRCCRRCWTPAR